uniref:Transmembrane protein n=1 Tax=Meloidogyne hapla TaxID=6305 RepID=A0A1I8BPX6_MELHA
MSGCFQGFSTDKHFILVFRMMFIFLSLLELAVVGFMSRNEGGGVVFGSQLDNMGKHNRTLNNISEISAWKDMPSPKFGLKQAQDYGGAPTTFMIPSFHAPNNLYDSQLSSVEKTSTGSFSGAPLFNLRMPSRTHSREGHRQNKFSKNEESGSCCIKRLWHRMHQITPEQVDKYRCLSFHIL